MAKNLKSQTPSEDLTAAKFLEQLEFLRSDEERRKLLRYFKPEAGGAADTFMGVRMGEVFALASAMMEMPLPEVEKLLESPVHEARVGAVSIMDFQARSKKTPPGRRKELFELYLRRHDRINQWDLVDRAAPHVVGGYLYAQPRGILCDLARSANTWERRTAIVSTAYFIRQRQVSDTFAIAEILVNDPEDLIQKAVGGWVREAGKKAPQQLYDFLDRHAATMPRTMLRYAIEKLDEQQKKHYMALKKA